VSRTPGGFGVKILLDETSDQSLRYQQNLAGRKIAILQLSTNKLRPIRAAASQIQSAVAMMQAGEFRELKIH